MKLPESVRESMLEEIESYLDAVVEPDAEPVAEHVIEQLELGADEFDIQDIVAQLEESGAIDGTLAEGLTEAFETQSEFVFTGEEVISTLEKLCVIEWVDDDEFLD